MRGSAGIGGSASSSVIVAWRTRRTARRSRASRIAWAKPPGWRAMVYISKAGPIRPSVPVSRSMCSPSTTKGKRPKAKAATTVPTRLPRPPTTTMITRRSDIWNWKAMLSELTKPTALPHSAPEMPASAPERVKANSLERATSMPNDCATASFSRMARNARPRRVRVTLESSTQTSTRTVSTTASMSDWSMSMVSPHNRRGSSTPADPPVSAPQRSAKLYIMKPNAMVTIAR